MNKPLAIRLLRVAAVAATCLIAAACATIATPGVSGDSTHSIAQTPARAAVTSAHPLATRAALDILDRGGSPIDAAIAAQMVLGLVEPQSSGIGGGSLVMMWDAATAKLTSYDGLAAAPARVTDALTTDVDGSTLKREDVRHGGRSVGVPGTLVVLETIHRTHGKLPWASLFTPAIDLAEHGFPMPPYLHALLSAPAAAVHYPEMLPYYFDSERKLRAVGATITNPAYASALRRIAAQGAAGLWRSGAGAALIAAAQRGFRPSLMTESDLAAYRAEQRDPLCAPFLAYSVCVMGPPSFGGMVVLQVLQMLEARSAPATSIKRFDFDDPEFVHYFAEAGRLAQADRRHYVGDPGFVDVPARELVAAAYVRERAMQIDQAQRRKNAAPGVVGATHQNESALGVASADATSQLAIVDRDGSVLSMTTTVNLNFGSRLMVDGFVLNNALTNFSRNPRAGQRAPNRMQSGKRPVSAMAPTIVFDQQGKPLAAGGSAGGGQIVDYIAASLVEMLANARTPAAALARGHVSTAVPGKLQLERGTKAASLAAALKAKRHDVDVVPMPSGLGFLKRYGDGWIGAADPRRDGVAEGR